MLAVRRMNAATHLVLVVSESLWPALQSVVHSHAEGGLRRVLLYHTDNAAGSRDPARRLERFVRNAFPDLEVLRREGGNSAGAFAEQLDAWRAEAPQDSWIVVFSGALDTLALGAAHWVGSPASRLILRRPGRDWVELRRRSGGALEEVPLGGMRREETDTLPLAQIIRSQWLEAAGEPEPRFEPAALPTSALVPLTEAAIAQDWRWPEAFRAVDLDPGQASPTVLFARYVATLLTSLGVPNVARNTRSADADESQIWAQCGGRLVVLDARLNPAAEDDSVDESALHGQILRFARSLLPVAGLAPEGWLLRPSDRFSPVTIASAELRGLGVLDLPACQELPARLATLFGLPLSTDGVEVERRLRLHLTESGRTRLFGVEPAVLREQRSSHRDPSWADADAWLERVMRERGQNWLLWTHRGTAHLRVQVDDRAGAGEEWRQLLAAIARLGAEEVHCTTFAKTVYLDFPARAESRGWVAEWLQPFLNKPLRFAEAQARFAARARVEAEARQVAGVAAPPPAAPANPKPTPRPPSARPNPRPPAPKPAPRERPPINPLADLDQALDAALGGGS